MQNVDSFLLIETPKMELKLEIKVYNLGLFFLAFPVDSWQVSCGWPLASWGYHTGFTDPWPIGFCPMAGSWGLNSDLFPWFTGFVGESETFHGGDTPVLIPHIFVWGSCFWFCIPGSFSSRRLPHTHTNNTLTHTNTHNHTHTHTHSHTHNTLTLTHTHTHTHTNNTLTHTQTTHSHTQTTHSHTHKHTQHTHTHTNTHNTLTLTHTHTHTHTNNTLTHTHKQHTHTHTNITLTHTHKHTFCVAGVAQTHIYRHFTWPAWHNLTSTVVLRGRHGTYGTGWRAWTWLGARDAAAFCVAGVAQTHIYRHFTWQAWHNLTSTVVLRGRRGTKSHLPSFHVAGVAQPHIYRRFAWQAWHLWHWVARLDLVRRPWRRGILRGRRGTTSHLPSSHVAGVAQPHIYRRFAWQAWHLWHWVARLDLVRRPWRRGILRGRRGTTSHLPSSHVAGVAQPHIYRRFAWQAWHLWHWVARLDLVRRPWRRGIVRGRRGTTSHLPSFHVAGVAPPHIYRRFAWQAWHLWHWVARLDLVRRPWRRGIVRGRRGTTSHLPSFHVAGVAQPHIYRRFAWQAWHLWHWVARLDLVRRPWRRGILRGRRGTTSHLPSFHVAGVAQPHIYRRFARLDLVRRPWRRGILRGRRGTTSHLPSFHVAGVAPPHIYRRFAWQAWHLWHWVARLDLVRRPWRRGIVRGSHFTRGTTSHLPSIHVAGVAPPHIYRRFAWQAWHLWHWVARLDLVRRPWRRGILRGRRGTTSHLPSFHVAGVAPPHIYRRFAWQAWHLWHWVARLDLVRRPWRRGILRGRRGTTSHLPSFHVAGVALMALGGALGLGFGVRGRRGTKSHLPSFCVGLAWQVWHRWQQKHASTLFLRGSDMFPGLFTYVMFRHVLWSLWHVLSSDTLPASLRLFCWLVYACPAPA